MPAAAVIPAPIAYIKVVAVKKLVVECGASVWVFLCCCAGAFGSLCSGTLCPPCSLERESSRGLGLRLECVFSAGVTSVWCLLKHSYYCEKIRVFQAVIF